VSDSSVADVLANGPESKAKLNATYVAGTNVTAFGAKGDGVTDDTASFRAAVVAAAGKPINVPAGPYVLNSLLIDAKARFMLDDAAVLKLAPNSPQMFSYTGTVLVVRGGTIDGNRLNQTGRPVIFAGNVSEGDVINFARVTFKSTTKAAFYIQTFGGFASIIDCEFSDMAEHTGTGDNQTEVLTVTDGQVGARGLLRFNRNRVFGTVTPALDGANPGGLFLASSVANGDTGNESMLECKDNYFYGIGQNFGPTDISAIHFYPAWTGAIITGNTFEQPSYSAITAKCVRDFICTDNQFFGGAINAQNFATEGVIGYAPGYHAASNQRPRAIIANNIIDNPGGESTANRQCGINIAGTPTSHATDVLVLGNVINGGGTGIRTINLDDGVYFGNIINGDDSAAAGSQHGMTFDLCYGEIMVDGNMIKTKNGHAIRATVGCATARFTLQGNKLKNSAVGYAGAIMRGMSFLKVTGNEFDVVTQAFNAQSDGTNKVGWLAWDASNTVVSGSVSIDFAGGVTKATGQLIDVGTPVGTVTPGEVGTTYRQLDGTGDGIMWMATGTTSSTWTKMLSIAAGPASANRLLAYTYDPIMAAIAQAAGTAGVLNVAKVQMLGGGIVSKVVFHVSTAGAGLTAGQCLIGVYDSSWALIVETDDLSTMLASTGAKTVSLASATTSQPPGAEVFVALLWNGTTGPQLRGFNGTGQPNMGISALADMRFATSGSGLTDLPATMGTKAVSGAPATPWFGLS
jgi:hypothetical protein